MVIGDKLKELRETKKLSQGDIEKRTGLLRCCISRVENGHTVPNVDTLEKMARALEVPMYRLFTDEDRIGKPAISFSKGEKPRNKKERRTSSFRQSALANEREGPRASASHGFENGEPRVGSWIVVAAFSIVPNPAL
jgi:transcriptional regulator with XRE-family HTH domain